MIGTWQKGITNEDYHNAAEYQKFFSSTNIKNFITHSPLHCHYNKHNPTPETPAMRFGTLFHAVALEPETVTVAPVINKRTNAGKTEWAEFQAMNEGKVIATPEEYSQAREMVASIKRHRIAGPLLEAPGEVELSGFFKEPVMGIHGKLRCDKILPDDRIIMDLKSTMDASEEAFSKAIYNLGYDISGAWYNLGAHQIDKKSYDVLLVAVEKTPPFGCNVFRLTEKHFEIAYSKIDAILDDLSKCIQKDTWPSYPQRLLNPEIPAWESRKYYGHIRQ